MTKCRNNSRFFVQLECKHLVYFKSAGSCPHATNLIACFRCPKILDRVVYKRVVFSPNAIMKKNEIKHIGLSVVCNSEKCLYYEVYYADLKMAMNSAKNHNTTTRHSSFVVRNNKIMIASFTIGFGTYQPEMPFQYDSRALM